MTVHDALRRTGRALVAASVLVLGGGIGWALAPPASTYLGPLAVQVEVVPALDPGVRVLLPPIGQVDFATHRAPVAVDVSVESVDVDSAGALLGSPQALLALQVGAPQVLREAVTRAAVSAAAGALLGALALGTLVYRRPGPVARIGAGALTAMVTAGGVVALTLDPAALQQPRFTGLLSRAPYVAGATTSALERLESYRSGLADLVQAVGSLYATAGQVPVLPPEEGVVRVLHVSDIHLNPLGFDVTERLVEQFGADVVVDTGDVTTWGTPIESTFLDRVGDLGVPYVFVRGNHDSRGTQAAVAEQPNAVVLDGDVAEVAGLTFAGTGDPEFTPEEGEGAGDDTRRDKVGESVEELADVVERHERSNPDDPVDVAVLHDPSKLDALLGEVPLVLAGHYHYRVVREDPSGTRVMVEASTGGAGITSAGLARLGQGEPLALSATLLHFATQGERAGEVVAYDQVTVGGLGLASVTVERTAVPPAEEGAARDGRPEQDTHATPSGSPVP